MCKILRETTTLFILIKEEEPIHQRISQLINSLEEGVQRRFAQSIGVASGVIGDILGQRKSKPGFDIISKILHAYPQLRAEWLMRGEGEMLKSAESPRKIFVSADLPILSSNTGSAGGFGSLFAHTNRTQPHIPSRAEALAATQNDKGDPIYVVVDFKAAANYLDGYQSREYYDSLNAVTMPRALVGSSSQGILFQIEGDSMTPRFQHGDWVAAALLGPNEVDQVQDFDCCVVVSTTNGIRFKRVKNRLNASPKYIQCKSDNRRYRSFNIDGANLLQIFRFVLHISPDASNPDDKLHEKIDHLEDTTSDLHTKYEQLARQIVEMQSTLQPTHSPENPE